ncbi:uncharacterized protein LY89DRAFT_733186 [Mollisia scopiformis]|uniref:Uncharacterized protein n=1 Tax=Mollisia scopiformis TaxID=149040 RepID=A0A194XAY4_MOLSC|nr:uncharacterized protein LY89DRAFT_733186 [Mollisia scopiformis]KUJ17331.1 hypothetical protein LY89DRAFT_733186 [Mollisia scopiformis]
MPSSILALESSYNATYTGTMPVGVTLTQGGGVSETATSEVGATTSTGSRDASSSGANLDSSSRRTTSALSTSTFTLNGGGGVTTPTAQASTSQNLVATQTGSTGVATGLRGRVDMVFGLVIFGFSIFVLHV